MTTPNPGLQLRSVTLASGVQLELAEQGPRDGPPVLLLHGSTDSWRSFEPLLPHLPPHWHVIVPSLRGHGGSDKRARSYRVDDFAADIGALAGQLGLRPMLVVGHSMGAAIALHLARTQPQRLRALVAAAAFASFADKAELADFHASAIEPLVDPVPRELAIEFQRSTIAGAVPPGLLETMVGESLRVPAHVWRGAFAGLMQHDVLAGLPRIAVPALLAWGSADAYVPREDQERLLRALPDARLQVFAGAGHALHWEQPQAFADLLRSFAAHAELETLA